ncbi:MAG: hypothetical protein A3E80_01410 [Chlamydiae bacterium RIFCSPHIGHO2_12_FULL_49_9]|nr:MAG: hypothetical protein A3E80_01410 [Chlamydiae bacterium RIFCSPHIGHO2_12_FULL_49_9]
MLIAAGGSGGHLFPARQLALMLQKEGECKILFAGYKLSESPFFEKEGIAFREIRSAPFANIFPFLKALCVGFCESASLLRKFKPDVVVGFGSYHSFPILLASFILRKKIVLFEANTTLGKVNRLFAGGAKTVAIQFPVAGSYPKTFVPFLPWGGRKREIPQEEARLKLGLEKELFTLLVFGGSQGASFLNDALVKAAPLLQKRGLAFQVIHLTGKEEEKTKEAYQTHSVRALVKNFEKEMQVAYAAADLVISRSGAGTVAELICHQKPALLIPFPFAADNHQEKNGHLLADEIKGARLLLQKEASIEKIVEEIFSMIQDLSSYKEALMRAFQGAKGRKNLSEIVRSFL